jgi:predicted lipoprotein with Yx(FWY)xxD motif
MIAKRLLLLLALSAGALAAAPGAAMAGTLIRVFESSSFGPVLHDGRGQAIYAFTYDRPGRSRCYGECARDWPPVKTVGKPRAGKRVDADLLGTTRRRDGSSQVTYKGRPLYFYRNEGRRQIFCQNVFSFGGRWLVVRPSGRLVR